MISLVPERLVTVPSIVASYIGDYTFLYEKVKPRRIMRVLHVLTLNTADGKYGGPVRVAKELCQELRKQGVDTVIFAGTLAGREPEKSSTLEEHYVTTKALVNFLPISSLWSWRLVSKLNSLVKTSDLVHIHFARDLVSFATALICLLNRKKFVTQSHGMIVSDGRKLTKLIDFAFTRPLWKRASVAFALTDQEISAILEISDYINVVKLPNGIHVDELSKSSSHLDDLRIGFVSRLHHSKRVEFFLRLAEAFKDQKYRFEIYGPDGGDLKNVIDFVETRQLSKNVCYMGSLAPSEVVTKLCELDLLVLPSSYDPFPMVILEALSVGTPVLVMPSCGLAETLKTLNPDFVVEIESESGLMESFNRLIGNLAHISRQSIVDFCKNTFSISSVCYNLHCYYLECMRKVN